MSQAQRTVKILRIRQAGQPLAGTDSFFGDHVDVVYADTFDQAHHMLAADIYDFILAEPESIHTLERAEMVQANPEWVEAVTEGIGIVDQRGELVWANPRLIGFSDEVKGFLRRECGNAFDTNVDGGLKPDQTSRRVCFMSSEDRVFELTTTPIIDIDHEITQVVGVIWDVTRARQRQQQLAAIDSAGRELIKLDTEQIAKLDVPERLALLEQKIVHYLHELMHFDNFTIHVLDQKSNKLRLAVTSGLPDTVEDFDLYASAEGNGTSGYVASTGKSYVCRDVTNDPHYLRGLDEAASSLTVPLRLNDQLIGVLNVESMTKDAFDEEDQQLAERFGRDIATALHMLDLMVTERHTIRGQLGSDVKAEITAPLNDILTDVENLIEDYIGHDDLRLRLNKIAEYATTIRDSIKNVTSSKRAIIGRGVGPTRNDPILGGKHILIADDESMIRDTVKDVLTGVGCKVVTACCGQEAIDHLAEKPFDLVLSDIRMPDRNGYEVFAAAKDANVATPVILMTGFGYDPNHAIVRARREGLAAVLFKPFKVDQLIGEIRSAVKNAAK